MKTMIFTILDTPQWKNIGHYESNYGVNLSYLIIGEVDE